MKAVPYSTSHISCFGRTKFFQLGSLISGQISRRHPSILVAQNHLTELQISDIIYGMGYFSTQDTYGGLTLHFKCRMVEISANLEEVKFAQHK